MNSSRKGFKRSALAAFAASTCIALTVQAQMPDPNMQMPQPDPSMQMPMTDPNMQMPQPQPQQQQRRQNPFKQLFAGTLTAVLQTTGVGLVTGLTQMMTGAISNWFNRPRKGQAANIVADPNAGMGAMPPMAAGTYDPMAGMQPPPMPPPTDGMQPGSMGGMQSPGPGNPGGGMPGAPPDPMAGMQSPGATPGYPPDATGGGMQVSGGAQMGRPQPSMPPAIYAGLAYEVQAISRTGATMTVDPATHTFTTGDRFVVMYRPSLPGQVALYNTTFGPDGRPLGPEKLVDTVNVAAGELTRLGPYEFRNNQGREALRLLLTACRNEALMATTRDIVKVDDAPVAAQAAAAPPAINFQNCSNVATRDVDRPQPRDIVKVSAEEGTIFALDPVSPQEIQAGNIAPRELTLTFNHR